MVSSSRFQDQFCTKLPLASDWLWQLGHGVFKPIFRPILHINAARLLLAGRFEEMVSSSQFQISFCTEFIPSPRGDL